jgi:hypothetical protein
MSDEDFTREPDPANRIVDPKDPVVHTSPYVPPPYVPPTVDLDQLREGARGDLARGLLYLLTFAIGGVLVFIGTGRLDGTVLTQSVFPSLIALAGTALGFYFGSQSNNSNTASSGKPVPPAANPQG